MSADPGQESRAEFFQRLDGFGLGTEVGDAFRREVGRLLPGSSSLPAVAVLARKEWRPRKEESLSPWLPGQLMGLKELGKDGDSSGSRFFTPVAPFRFPAGDVTTESLAVPGEGRVRIRIRPQSSSRPLTLQMMLVPWVLEGDAPVLDAELRDRLLQLCGQGLLQSVSAVAEGRGGRLSLPVVFGLPAFALTRQLESLRFAFNYAASLFTGVVFRLEIDTGLLRQILPVGDAGGEFHLEVSLPDSQLNHLYRLAGLDSYFRPGCTFLVNAMPLLNAELRAWLAEQPYREFVEQAGARPLGVAGVFPYHQEIGADTFLNDQDPDSKFSLEINPQTGVLTRFWSEGGGNSDTPHQLMVWTTAGAVLNGQSFQVERRTQQSHLERLTAEWQGGELPLPAFGGKDPAGAGAEQNPVSLSLTLAPAPQLLAYRGGLRQVVGNLFHQLGYTDLQQDGPSFELRLHDGIRQRVAVLRVRNRGGRPVSADHLLAVQRFVDERAPVGQVIAVEQAGPI